MLIQTILDLIGNTPLLKVDTFIPNGNVFAKLEMFNLTGSVKDRSAFGMIEAAEKKRILKPGITIIESTSGNLGIAIATIGRLKGYRTILVVDPSIPQFKINAIKAVGGEIVMVEKPDEYGAYMPMRVLKMKELLSSVPHSINLNQYDNPDNPHAHYESTGPEIVNELNGKVDILIGSVSTCGTLCGTARFLKEKLPHVHVIGVEPVGSTIFGGIYKPFGKYGAGSRLVTGNCDCTVIDEKVKVSDENAYKMIKLFAQKEHLLLGPSSGLALYMAVEKAKQFGKEKNIVVICPDHGNRYLDTIYSENKN